MDSTQAERIKEAAAYLERFWSKVDKSGECWEWVAARHRQGYGVISIEGRMWFAHRYIDHVLNGPHQDGEQTLHKCDNPSCVRPSHLERGDQVKNMRDMIHRGRKTQIRGEDHPSAKITSREVLEIRRLAEEGVLLKAIAAQYGISRQAVSDIIHRRRWAHLEESS